jgi:glycosyltransferase involved in cell wall biosynthesis
MPDKDLSIVVIGRNEAENLAVLHESLQQLMRVLHCETIFVDSASTDESVAVAQRLFDRTVVLELSPCLSASAGRAVGSSLAGGSWVLFLDGDMRLVEGAGRKIVDHMRAGSEGIGATGSYVHEYEGGVNRRWTPEVDKDGRVLRFGGAVLLSRFILGQESWDPRLYSNEEVELYTRMRARGFSVSMLEGDLIAHHTDVIPPFRRLFGAFLPWGSFLGKKFFGMGQVVRARIKAGTLMSLIRWFPGPFVLWSGIACALICGAMIGMFYGVGILLATI